MTKSTAKTVTTVKGGKVYRNATSGHFVSVVSARGVSSARPKSSQIMQETSNKRHEALKRLKDR